MTNLLYKASIVTTPTAYGVGVLNSIKPAQYLGADLIINGNFSADSNWSKGTGWSISGGSANCDGSQTTNSSIYQTNVVEVGKTYLVTYTATITSGQIRAKAGFSGNGTFRTQSGIYQEYIVAVTNATFYLEGDADFVGNIDNVSVEEKINADFDFTRTSSATRVNPDYLIETVATDIPRLDYTNGTASILLENQSTNLITYSEDFSDSSWTKTNSTVTSGFVSPDGTTNAFKLTSTSVSGGNIIARPSLVVNSANTNSIYLKRVSGTGNVSLFNTAGNELVVTLTTEWKRFSVTNSTNPSNAYTGVRLYGSSDEVLLFGAQTEALSYPTSYIPTSGQSGGVTRAAETLNNAGNSDLINSTEGVLYCEIAALTDLGSYRLISLSDGNLNQRITILYDITDNKIYGQCVNSTTQAFIPFVPTSISNMNKIAFKYKANDFALWVNGVEVGVDTSGVIPTGLDKLSFDRGDGVDDFYGKVKTIAVFKEALSDTELACLTSTNNREIFLNYYYRMQYVGANTEAVNCAEQTFNI